MICLTKKFLRFFPSVMFGLMTLIGASDVWGQSESNDPENSPEFQPSPVDIWVKALPFGTKESSTSVIGIDQTELGALPGASLPMILSSHAGITGVGQSGVPQNIAIRGLGAGAVLILLDGVPLNDPTSPDRSLDLGTIDMSRVASIQVFKGPQVARFGFGALAGVVDIRTKRRATKDPGFYPDASAGYGTFNTQKSRVGGTWQDVAGRSITLGVSSSRSDGYAVIDAPGAQRKPWQQTGVNGRFESPIGEVGFLTIGGHYDDRHQQLGVGPGQDAHDYENRNFESGYDARIEGSFLDDHWNPFLQWTASQTQRRYLNHVDPGDSTYLNESYRGKTQTIEAGQDYHLSGRTNIGFSLGEEQEEAAFPEGSFPEQENLRASRPFVFAGFRTFEEHVYELDVGARGNRDEGDSHVKPSFHVESNIYLLPPLSVMLAFHQAIRYASLYQKHAPLYGNDSLAHEVSKSYEWGFKQKWHRGGEMMISWYDARYDQLIDFDSGIGRFVNISKARSRGWELENKVDLRPNWQLGFNATVARSWNPTTGHRLARRPTEKYGLMSQWKFLPGWSTRWDWIRIGSRLNDNYSLTELSPYTLVNATLSWDLNQAYSLNLRGENLENKHYQETIGYQPPGRVMFVQLNWNGT